MGSEMGDDVLLVVAEEEGSPVAAALNLVGSHCLYGRNWGCEAGKDYKHLHFELCYYQVCTLAKQCSLGPRPARPREMRLYSVGHCCQVVGISAGCGRGEP